MTAARVARWGWLLVMLAATLPFLRGLSGSHIFYVRDLSMFFWGRHLFFRRELLSGQFPLWDPFSGGGQSAAADALRQMFLPPAVLARLIGTEVFGFNLWVLAPFPLAALGAWLFLRRRFSSGSASIGAIAFAVSGPIVSTANFPNMSWSVAAMPWVLWGIDRLVVRPGPRPVAVLALAVACQALAGEPVTLVSTLILAGAFAALVNAPECGPGSNQVRYLARVAVGVILGMSLAAVQLVPLKAAADLSFRTVGINSSFWSLHPLALLETVALHLFGDYYQAQNMKHAPWLPLLHDDREPFLFSLYLGLPLLTLAVYGLARFRPRRWSVFWGAAALASAIAAMGSYTSIYPFLQNHVPLLLAFRFPAKYIVVASMAVAAGASAGWEALGAGSVGGRARKLALGVAISVAELAALLAAACLYLPDRAMAFFLAVAHGVGAPAARHAAGVMLLTVPYYASLILLSGAATAVLLWRSTMPHAQAAMARRLLGALIVTDLIGHAWGVNPVFDAAYLAQPAWLEPVKVHPESRFYIGGKRDGSIDYDDLDSSTSLENPKGLIGSAGRAALAGQLNFEPSGFRVREMTSYDLPVLWPARHAQTVARFFVSSRGERDRFLDRTAVRYRILPQEQAGGRTPLMRAPFFPTLFLYDWGAQAMPRASIVPLARLMPNANAQCVALFSDRWDARAVVLVERDPMVEASPGRPATVPSATIVEDGLHRVVVEAEVAAGGGYLLLLDSYDEDWRTTVDGRPATMVRANGLFRAVRLAPGPHRIDFVYRPRAFFAGLTVTGVASIAWLAVVLWPSRRSHRPVMHAAAEP